LFDAAGRPMFPRPTHVFALRLDIETVVISRISSRAQIHRSDGGRRRRTLPSLVGISLVSCLHVTGRPGPSRMLLS